jgi:hypothetical protein
MRTSDVILVRDDNIPGLWSYIIPGYKINIWAGSSAKSIPKKDGLDYNDYTHFEVAFFQEKKHCATNLPLFIPMLNCFVSSMKVNLTKYYDQANSFHYFEVPKDKLLEAIVQFTNYISGTTNTETNSSNIRQEKNCQICSKKNDIGVNNCWWCGNTP